MRGQKRQGGRGSRQPTADGVCVGWQGPSRHSQGMLSLLNTQRPCLHPCLAPVVRQRPGSGTATAAHGCCWPDVATMPLFPGRLQAPLLPTCSGWKHLLMICRTYSCTPCLRATDSWEGLMVDISWSTLSARMLPLRTRGCSCSVVIALCQAMVMASLLGPNILDCGPPTQVVHRQTPTLCMTTHTSR